MLVLSRKLNQAIMIGDDVRIVVVAVDRDTVKLGIEAPRTIPVHRSEVYEEIQRTNRAAAGETAAAPPSASAEGPKVADLGMRRKTPAKD
ncbi:MAG TPA: carbon storage regulator CsrA [Candidatus Baltobacteraceae bacterium]|nr:carbon storage regulator CsrA [Candidatus Baltobacteraceae bacterium]